MARLCHRLAAHRFKDQLVRFAVGVDADMRPCEPQIPLRISSFPTPLCAAIAERIAFRVPMRRGS